MREVVTNFGGQVPRQSAFGLPSQLAVRATNTKLVSGELRGIRSLRILHDFADTDVQSAFRIPNAPDDFWMGFLSKDAVVIRAPISNDTFERFYWHEPGGRIFYNTKARILAGDPAFWLGVPQPGTQPTISSIVGGSVPAVARSYTYTFVSAYGEEGPPATPSDQGTGNDSATWNLANLTATVPDAANRNITHKNIYRTVTSATGNADFYFVAQIPVATTTYADSATDLEVATLGVNLQSTQWFPPEDELDGIVAFPNGVILMWHGSTVDMSVPYRPHAVSQLQSVSVRYPIVGIGVAGNTAVVATTGPPSAITMTTPDTASLTEIGAPEPCLSRGSIIGAPEGVYYASQNGLMFFGPGGFDNVTKGLISKDEWLRDYSPTTLRACRYQLQYIGITQPGIGYVLDGQDLRQGFVELNDLQGAVNIFNDVWSGEVYLVSAGRVLLWDDPNQPELLWRWASKRFTFPYEINIGACRLFTNKEGYNDLLPWPGSPPVAVYTPPVVAGDGVPAVVVGTVPNWAAFLLRVFVDGAKVFERYVFSKDTIKLPSGFKSDDWQFEILGARPLVKFEFAETAKELSKV